MNVPSSRETDWIMRYESLRAHAVGEAPLEYVPLGLGILRHRGVAAWIAVETSAAEAALEKRHPGAPKRASRDTFTAPSSDLVQWLADTVLLVATGRG